MNANCRTRAGGAGRSTRRGLLTLALALLALGKSGCSDAVKFGYVNVHVSIDRDSLSATQLFLVTSCEFKVTGAEETVPFDLRCRENNVAYDVGTFQWTSGKTSGNLQFVVQMFDGNHVLLAEGTSAPVSLSAGKVQEAAVVVMGVVGPGQPGGGADAATDGAVTDATVDVGASTDGSPADGG